MTIIYNFENTLMIKSKVFFEYNQFALLLYLPHSQNETNFHFNRRDLLVTKTNQFLRLVNFVPPSLFT